MVDVSTFEDPIDVKLAMLLRLPGRCVDRSTFEDPIDLNFIIILLAVVRELRRGLVLFIYLCLNIK